MLSINGLNHNLNIDEKNLSATIINKSTLKKYQQTTDKNINCVECYCKNNSILFSFTYNNVLLNGKYEIIIDETGEYIQLSLDSSENFKDNICFPPAFSVQKGDKLIEAYCEGICFPVESDIPIPTLRPLYGGRWNSMSFYGISCTNSEWLLCTIADNFDAALMTTKDNNNLYNTRIVWQPRMGSWGSVRRIRYYLGKGTPITSIAKQYRKVAIQKGLVKTLKEKSYQNPNIDKLAGSADLWLWNSDAMEKLYSEKAEYTEATDEQFNLRRKIAMEMKNIGMNDILWSIFDEKIDSHTVKEIKKLGYLTTYYDVYTDVIPAPLASKMTGTRLKRCENRMSYWPNSMVVNSDGSLCTAWKLKGIDGEFYHQNRMCDSEAIGCAKKYVTEHGKSNGLDGVFIDVTLCNTKECYSKEHPMDRKKSFEYKNALFEEINKIGLFAGTENGHEDVIRNYVYSEGMMSPGDYRPIDAGRKMTHLYSPSEIDEGNTKYMLNPEYRIPLFELVYHDCHVSYWYWGDSSNSCPELMKKRDLFNILYGQPPIYSFSVCDWDKLKYDILESYNRTVPLARKIRYCQMESFEIIDNDYNIQKTQFDDGTQVVVNFGNEIYDYHNNKINPLDYLVL